MISGQTFEDIIQAEFQQILNQQAKTAAEQATRNALYQQKVKEVADKINPVRKQVLDMWKRYGEISAMLADFSRQLNHFYYVEFHNVASYFQNNTDNPDGMRQIALKCSDKFEKFTDEIDKAAKEGRWKIPGVKELEASLQKAQQEIDAFLIELNAIKDHGNKQIFITRIKENCDKAIKEIKPAIDELTEVRQKLIIKKQELNKSIDTANEKAISFLRISAEYMKNVFEQAKKDHALIQKLKAQFEEYAAKVLKEIKDKQASDKKPGDDQPGQAPAGLQDSPSAGPATPPSDSVTPMSLASSRRSSNVSMKHESPEHSPKHSPPKEGGSVLSEQKVKEDKKAGVLDFSRLQISGAERAVSPASRAVSPSRPLSPKPSAPSALYFPAEEVAGRQVATPSAPTLKSNFGDKRVSHSPMLHRPVSPRAAQQAQQQNRTAATPKGPVG